MWVDWTQAFISTWVYGVGLGTYVVSSEFLLNLWEWPAFKFSFKTLLNQRKGHEKGSAS